MDSEAELEQLKSTTKALLRKQIIDGKSGKFRSVRWRLFLGVFDTNGQDEQWCLTLQKERQVYNELREKFIIDPGSIPDDPLSQSENSLWNQYFIDQDLRKLIIQDVIRTNPETPLFKTKSVQDLLTNILFIWSKLNPDISYRQGQNELVAILFHVVHSDAEMYSQLNSVLFDRNSLEQDIGILYFKLMENMKQWYEVNNPISLSTLFETIFNDYLKKLDVELYKHLTKLQIEPQIFGLRWVRLLFSREFELFDVLEVWDGIFAYDDSLNFVQWIFLAMLVSVRHLIISSDYTKSVTILMKYPRNILPISHYIPLAITLKNRYDEQFASFGTNLVALKTAPKNNIDIKSGLFEVLEILEMTGQDPSRTDYNINRAKTKLRDVIHDMESIELEKKSSVNSIPKYRSESAGSTAERVVEQMKAGFFGVTGALAGILENASSASLPLELSPSTYTRIQKSWPDSEATEMVDKY